MGNTLNEDIKCPHCGETINADVEQKKYKQLYDRYNQCRDAELDRFWKNSTFVWVMMALCYTAFGLLLSKYCGFDCEKTESNSVHKCVDECMKDRYEIALVVISIFGFVLSKIRIWMARGLKAWYEVYEDAIWDMEEKNNVFHYDRKYTIENYWYVKNDGFWLFKSNNYSPSKIVILIGRVMGFIWFVSLCVMLFKYYGCDFIKKDMLVFKWVTEYPNLVFWGMVTLIWIIIHLGLCLIKSSSLRDSEEEIVYHNIRHDNGIKCYKEYYNYDLTYFEVKNKIVSFIHENQEQFDKGKRFLSDYYRKEADVNQDELKISFPIKSIQKYYKKGTKSLTDAEKEISEIFSQFDKSLEIDAVRVYDGTISVYFNGYQYKDDISKITEIFDRLIKKKTKYSKFKVLYSFKESKDEN